MKIPVTTNQNIVRSKQIRHPEPRGRFGKLGESASANRRGLGDMRIPMAGYAGKFWLIDGYV